MLLSIIIPIYNSNLYLGKCLDSVLSQIGPDEELILIDDKSTDDSLKTCLQKKSNNIDKNIILINKDKNNGVAHSRNIGLKKASGRYILWIDSDDWVCETYIYDIKKIIGQTNADIILFDYYIRTNKTNKRLYLSNKQQTGYIEKIDIMTDVAQDKFYSYLWRIVAKKKLYKNITFPTKLNMMEDYMIYHLLFDNAITYFYIKKPLYYYRVLNNSLSHKQQNTLTLYNITLYREEFFRKKYLNIAAKYRLCPVLVSGSFVIGNKDLTDQPYGNFKHLIRKHLLFLLTRPYIKNKIKFKFILLAISIKLFKNLKMIYKKIKHI